MQVAFLNRKVVVFLIGNLVPWSMEKSSDLLVESPRVGTVAIQRLRV